MLTLTVNLGGRVHLYDDKGGWLGVVALGAVGDGKARICFDMPKSINIIREEVLNKSGFAREQAKDDNA